jgi:quinol monooxygenase YgiN
MKQYYAQHAKMIVSPGKRDELIQRLNESLELFTRIPGCIYYLIGKTEESNIVWLSELWISKEAKDAVAMAPESVKVMKEVMPFVVSVLDRTTMTVVNGFGIPQQL